MTPYEIKLPTMGGRRFVGIMRCSSILYVAVVFANGKSQKIKQEVMHSRYKYTCPPAPKRVPTSACCAAGAASKLPGSDPGAVPESVRIAEVKCGDIWTTQMIAKDCSYTTQKVKLPIAGGSVPFTDVGTRPASVTTMMKGESARITTVDPYNPATRFSQYFPAPPLPYECPERIPNNDPKPSTRECLPLRRFRGSKEET